MKDQRKWDRRFMELARLIASWSKDPSTQVGAVIVDTLGRIKGTGFNGFPRGVEDLESYYADRETKYKMVAHAERNALDFSEDVRGCTLYSTLPPCPDCAKGIIQRGIATVVCSETDNPRWAPDFVRYSMTMFNSAGVTVRKA